MLRHPYTRQNQPIASSAPQGVQNSNHKIIDRQQLKLLLERSPDLKRRVKEKHLQKLMAIDTLFDNDKRNIPLEADEDKQEEWLNEEEDEQAEAEEYDDGERQLPDPQLDLTPEMMPMLQKWNPAALQELLYKALSRFKNSKAEMTHLFDRSRTKGLSAKNMAHLNELTKGSFKSRQGGTNRIPRKQPVQKNSLFKQAQSERYRAHRDLRKAMRPSELAAIDEARRNYL